MIKGRWHGKRADGTIAFCIPASSGRAMGGSPLKGEAFALGTQDHSAIGCQLCDTVAIAHLPRQPGLAQVKGGAGAKGGKHNVVIARVPVIVRISYYGSVNTPAASADNSSKIPSSLQSAADSLAGNHASLVGVLLSFILIAVIIFYPAEAHRISLA